MSATGGRTNFLARVAGNSLDVVSREISLGPALLEREQVLLSDLLNTTGTVDELRWGLVHALRDKSMDLDRPDLHVYLRESVVNQVAIDQTKYSGFQFAANNAVEE
mgnify:FL=1